jgi:hypothetical protein
VALAKRKERKVRRKKSGGQGCEGQTGRKRMLHTLGGRPRVILSNMSSGSSDSSSETTKLNHKDIAAGMLKLAIVSSHILEHCADKASGAGTLFPCYIVFNFCSRVMGFGRRIVVVIHS